MKGEGIYEIVIREMTKTAVCERNDHSPEEQEMQAQIVELSRKMQEKMKDLPEDVRKSIMEYMVRHSKKSIK